MFSKIELPSTKKLVSTAASVAATAMLVRSVAKDFIPPELRHYFAIKSRNFLATFSNDMTITIEEFDGIGQNQLFTAAEIYLGTRISPSTKRFKASIPEKEQNIQVTMGGNEDLIDTFHGFQLKWRVIHQQNQPRYVRYDDYHSTTKVEFKFLKLTFHKKHKNKVLDEYLPYIVERSKVAKQERRTLKLHTLKSDGVRHYPPKTPWQSVNLDHPATKVTPAEVAEQLLKSDDPDLALQGLIEFLENKKESDKLKGENLEEIKKEDVKIVEENEVPKNDEGQNGLKVLTKMTPAEARDKVLKNDEALKALKVLIGLLGGENGIKDVKDSDSGFRASEVMCAPESGKEDETNAE